MKNLYINARLQSLLLADSLPVREWIFSRGEAWLLLTPERLRIMADRLGADDARITRLFDLARRHAARPELYCRRMGVSETRRLEPEQYPLALCPRCDGVHYPHPEDDGTLCPDCRKSERRTERIRPGGGELRDRRQDGTARETLRRNLPQVFDGDVLAPNFRLNLNRRLVRDWDKAVNRILMGAAYRKVAREFNCSVGLLHRKVHERRWENN